MERRSLEIQANLGQRLLSRRIYDSLRTEAAELDTEAGKGWADVGGVRAMKPKGVIQAVDVPLPMLEKQQLIQEIDVLCIQSFASCDNKARVFESVLGYNQFNPDQLIGKIQQGVLTDPAVLGKADQFGQRFTVDMSITGPNGNSAVVRTGWIFDPGSTVPRLATAYVK